MVVLTRFKKPKKDPKNLNQPTRELDKENPSSGVTNRYKIYYFSTFLLV